MKTLISVLFTLIFFTYSNAQNFFYQSNLSHDVRVNDAIKINHKFYLVGKIDSLGYSRPYFGILSNDGNLVFDTIINGNGEFVNIHLTNNSIHISYYFNPTPNYHTLFDFEYDTNFVFLNGVNIGDGILEKSKLLNDSLILYIGYEPPQFSNSVYSCFVAQQNIVSGKIDFIYPFFSQSQISTYDIIAPNTGKYHLFTNSPDSSSTEQLSVHFLNDSLQRHKTFQIKSSYSLFGSDSSIMGAMSAEFVSNSIFLNSIANHPRYLNQNNSYDVAFIKFDTTYNELALSFSGNNDTNYTTTRNSISYSDGHFYTAATGNNDIILSKHDTLNNSLNVGFFHNGSTLELSKVLTFSDSVLLVGKTNSQYFALKLDSISNQLNTGLESRKHPTLSQFKVFPNPTKNILYFSSEKARAKKVQIYDQNGILIIENNSIRKNAISVGDLKAGLYYLKIISEEDIVQTYIFVKM